MEFDYSSVIYSWGRASSTVNTIACSLQSSSPLFSIFRYATRDFKYGG